MKRTFTQDPSGGARGGGWAAKRLPFSSRRSAVMGSGGGCASSQPAATAAGIKILAAGGNATDAAVAIAAALGVTEPCSTGIGGDCFGLFFKADTGAVEAMLGNGRSPSGLSLDRLAQAGFGVDAAPLDPLSALCVTVPGAPMAWEDAVRRHGSGKLSLADVLAPAIELAEQGFVVEPVAAHAWEKAAQLLAGAANGTELLVQDPSAPGALSVGPAEGGAGGWRAPAAGEVMTRPGLAATMRRVAADGAHKGFYTGELAAGIAQVVQQSGGVLTEADLEAHRSSEFREPISVEYNQLRVYEVPPPTQGLAALLALKISEGLYPGESHNSALYLHGLVEAMRLSFADARAYIADEQLVDVPTAGLLSAEYLAARKAQIQPEAAQADVVAGQPPSGCDTVQVIGRSPG